MTNWLKFSMPFCLFPMDTAVFLVRIAVAMVQFFLQATVDCQPSPSAELRNIEIRNTKFKKRDIKSKQYM